MIAVKIEEIAVHVVAISFHIIPPPSYSSVYIKV